MQAWAWGEKAAAATRAIELLCCYLYRCLYCCLYCAAHAAPPRCQPHPCLGHLSKGCLNKVVV